MSKENKKQRRNFSVLFRILQLILLLIFVFFLSFFVTIIVKAPHPIDFMKAEIFEDTTTDKLINEYEKDKSKTEKIDINDKKNLSSESAKVPDDKTLERNDDKPIKSKTFDDSSLSGKWERIQLIKQAVNEKMNFNRLVRDCRIENKSVHR